MGNWLPTGPLQTKAGRISLQSLGHETVEIFSQERSGDPGSADGTAWTGGVGAAGGPAVPAAASRVWTRWAGGKCGMYISSGGYGWKEKKRRSLGRMDFNEMYRSGGKSFDSSMGVWRYRNRTDVSQMLLPLETWAVFFFFRPSRGQAPANKKIHERGIGRFPEFFPDFWIRTQFRTDGSPDGVQPCLQNCFANCRWQMCPEWTSMEPENGRFGKAEPDLPPACNTMIERRTGDSHMDVEDGFRALLEKINEHTVDKVPRIRACWTQPAHCFRF